MRWRRWRGRWRRTTLRRGGWRGRGGGAVESGVWGGGPGFRRSGTSAAAWASWPPKIATKGELMGTTTGAVRGVSSETAAGAGTH